MPSFDRGKLTIQSRDLSLLVDLPLVKIIEYDCYKPPTGTITDFRPGLTVKPVVDARFLQQRESSHLLEGAANPGEVGLTVTQLKNEIATQFQFSDTTIDRANIPQNWKQVVPCFKVTILYDAFTFAHEITAKAKVDATLGGVSYPAGDTVASFRMIVPTGRYQFIRRKEPNSNCCPAQDSGGIIDEHSQTFPRFAFEFDQDFNFEDWYLDPGFRYRLHDRWNLDLRGHYRRDDDDD